MSQPADYPRRSVQAFACWLLAQGQGFKSWTFIFFGWKTRKSRIKDLDFKHKVFTFVIAMRLRIVVLRISTVIREGIWTQLRGSASELQCRTSLDWDTDHNLPTCPNYSRRLWESKYSTEHVVPGCQWIRPRSEGLMSAGFQRSDHSKSYCK